MSQHPDAMDFFFQERQPPHLFWPESLLPIDDTPSVPFHKQTAFVPFTPPHYNPFLTETSNFPSNTRKTMLPPPLPPPVKETELNNDRSYRHMMTERLRRKTMRQSFTDLHSLLPRGSKNNKNSIVQMATLQLQKLQGEKEALWRKNKELESGAAWTDQNMENSTINLRVANPSSPIDSMIEVMKCLKAQQLKLKKIRTEFSSQELQAKLQIESTIATAAVEKSVECTLKEVERKFWLDLKEGS